ncbi:hypothetical protein M8J77_013900 [Diaphorina citri]|nr:hypothetical protein M8J77_013900 [Diaphorina citri]
MQPTLSFGTMTTYPPDDLLEDPPTTLHFPEDLLVAPSDDRIHNQDSVRILLPNSCCKRAPPTAPTNVGSPNVGLPRNVGAPTNVGSTNVGGAAALHNYSAVKSSFSRKLLKSDSLLHFSHQKKKLQTSTQTPPYLLPPVQPESKITMVDHVQCVNQERLIYSSGCISHLVYWIQSTRDIMFVLLYCVISFLKLCFLGILSQESPLYIHLYPSTSSLGVFMNRAEMSSDDVR